MSNRRYQQLRKNPLVQLIRRIYKFLNNLFQPRRRLPNTTHHQSFSDEQIDLDLFPVPELEIPEPPKSNEFITIGELFEQVKWQVPEIEIRKPVVKQQRVAKPRTGLPKKDRLLTVGEVFAQVKWKVPEAIVPEQVLNTRKISRPHDASRN
jgi:hypothetical protein